MAVSMATRPSKLTHASTSASNQLVVDALSSQSAEHSKQLASLTTAHKEEVASLTQMISEQAKEHSKQMADALEKQASAMGQLAVAMAEGVRK